MIRKQKVDSTGSPRRPVMRGSGFTLLELLVVIGIIALLVSFAAVSYNAAQVRTRDARRKGDLNAMRDALEQYYSASNFLYPDTCEDADTYLSASWPNDPGTYTYNDGDAGACTTISYCICAQLETGSGGNSTTNGCAWGSGAYFCVANAQ